MEEGPRAPSPNLESQTVVGSQIVSDLGDLFARQRFRLFKLLSSDQILREVYHISGLIFRRI